MYEPYLDCNRKWEQRSGKSEIRKQNRGDSLGLSKKNTCHQYFTLNCTCSFHVITHVLFRSFPMSLFSNKPVSIGGFEGGSWAPETLLSSSHSILSQPSPNRAAPPLPLPPLSQSFPVHDSNNNNKSRACYIPVLSYSPVGLVEAAMVAAPEAGVSTLSMAQSYLLTCSSFWSSTVAESPCL